MLISVVYDAGSGWTVDENKAVQIPEFKALLSQEDGTRAMSFVVLYADPLGFLAEVYENEEERFADAAKAVYGKEPKTLKTKKITEAIEKYRRLAMTKNVKIRQQMQNGMVRVGQYIEETGKNLKEENIDTFMKTLKGMPALLNELEVVETTDKEPAKTIRGKRQLTYREQKSSGK